MQQSKRLDTPMATKSPAGITPLNDFLETLHQAQPALMLKAPLAAVAKLEAASEMHAFLLDHYVGVESVHSFEDENGSVFDCVPVERQPSLRGVAQKPAQPPALPRAETHAASGPSDERKATLIGGLDPNRKDAHGNAMFCPPGAIPMRRLTVENLARFQTLQHFFQKSPLGSARPPHAGGIGGDAPPKQAASQASVAATHRWAHAFQNVANLGGHSKLNVWDPAIGANQIFSLSQHWYVGGSAAKLQTAEVGWQVYPQMYGNTKPAFFIYWTADGYKSTGNYNLTKKAFVQTSNKVAIGGALAPSSVQGGAQFEIDVSFYLHGGLWWLYFGGGAPSNAIGYYPTSLYNGGAMAAHAAEIDYGGETVGTTSWPPMGSGKFANTGWQHACYQRDINFFPTGGGVTSAALTPAQASPQCYTVSTPTKFNPPWNETIFFGGPGGTNC